MALTIHKEPELYTPSDNPITWVFSSDETAQANFSFKIEVYVDTKLIEEHIIFPETGEYAHFDASEIVSPLCSASGIDQTTVDGDAGNYRALRLDIIESYGDPASDQSTTSTSTVRPYKAALTDSDYINYDADDYSADVSGSQFMNSFPSSGQYMCGLNEDAFLSLITKTLQITLTIRLFDVSGVQITSGSYVYNPNQIEQFSVGPQVIINDGNFSITQAHFDQAHYYTISVENVSTANVTEFTIYIDQLCSDYLTRRFLFLNKLGAIDAFTYTLVSREKRTISSKSYEKQFGQWDGNDFVYSLDDGRKRNYVVMSEGMIEANSDWMDEDTQEWISRELYESPAVWMYDEEKTQRVNIKVSNTEVKKHDNDRLINEQIRVELSEYRKSAVI